MNPDDLYTAYPNELVPNYFGLASILPAPNGDSPARIQMVMSQIEQTLVIDGAEPQRFNSGTAMDIGNYTFKVKAPEDLMVIAVIPRFRVGVSGGFRHNSESILVYRAINTNRINALILPNHFSAHHHFGFKYNPKIDLSRVREQQFFEKGEILYDSPNIDSQGNYCFGTELTVARVSLPGVIEDGSILRRGALSKFRTYGYEKRIVTFGRRQYPANLYGDARNYKIFPDIGEHVRDDGVLFALRDYDPICDVVNLMPGATRKVDYVHDQKTFVVQVKPNARVVDVRVEYSPRRRGVSLPEGMDGQLRRYLNARDSFNRKVWDIYTKMGGPEKDRRIGEEFSHLLTQAYGETIEGDPFNVKNTLRGEMLDEWYVEITFEYEVPMDVGNKVADTHGGKTIVCKIIEDDDALRLADGTMVDMMIDGNSLTKRMNTSAGLELNINSSRMRAERELAALMAATGDREKALQYTKDFLAVAAPSQWRAFMGHENPFKTNLMEVPPVADRPSFDWSSYLDYTLEHGFYITSPACIPEEHLDIMEMLETHYPPMREHLYFRNEKGEIEQTYEKVLVGTMYVIRLEKTGQDWSSVSTARLQHYGIPAKLTNWDKYSAPYREMPVRLFDESTLRLLAAAVGGNVIAKTIEESNNPTLHRSMRRKILLAEDPSAIENINDKNVEDLGISRINQFVNQMMSCAGIAFRRHRLTEVNDGNDQSA